MLHSSRSCRARASVRRTGRCWATWGRTFWWSGWGGGWRGFGLRVRVCVHGFRPGDLTEVHQAESWGYVGFREGLAADAAFGLKFAQGVDATIHNVDRLGARPVDGFLLRGGFGDLHGVEDGDSGDVPFDHAATAKTPGSRS